jgi:hypothetical protein
MHTFIVLVYAVQLRITLGVESIIEATRGLYDGDKDDYSNTNPQTLW